jgi:hypothetical protein
VSAVLETHETSALYQTPVSEEVRLAALEQAVAEQTAEGWQPERKPDVERVLVGHSKFRRTLVRRQWGFRTIRELVDIDNRGTVSIRRV